jgi:hypothetical protein
MTQKIKKFFNISKLNDFRAQMLQKNRFFLQCLTKFIAMDAVMTAMVFVSSPPVLIYNHLIGHLPAAGGRR